MKTALLNYSSYYFIAGTLFAFLLKDQDIVIIDLVFIYIAGAAALCALQDKKKEGNCY